eukprot:jgi/Mesvir1/28593/Mv01007-RA.1
MAMASRIGMAPRRGAPPPSMPEVYRDAFLRSKVMKRNRKGGDPERRDVAPCPVAAGNPSDASAYAVFNEACETLAEVRGVLSGRQVVNALALPLERCEDQCNGHGMCVPLNKRTTAAHL